MARSKAGLTTSWPGRIAFVHIPKTAGNSVIGAFERALGVMRCASFVPAITDESFLTRMFVSGHVQLSQITPRAFAFTFLRDPLRQIASHLRWLDHYTLPQYAKELVEFSESTLQSIAMIGRTDLTDAGSIAAFFDWLPEPSHTRLVNVQCEVLAAEKERMRYTNADEMAAAAIESLDQLDFVGLTHQLQPDMRILFRMLGIRRAPVLSRLNEAMSTRPIDIDNPAIRRVLSRQVEADLVLFNEVRNRRTALPYRMLRRARRVVGDTMPGALPTRIDNARPGGIGEPQT